MTADEQWEIPVVFETRKINNSSTGTINLSRKGKILQMAVTYTNNFNNIMDKLMETIKAEMPIPVQKNNIRTPIIKSK